MAVHDIAMQPIAPALLRSLGVTSEVTEVTGKNGRGDDGFHLVMMLRTEWAFRAVLLFVPVGRSRQDKNPRRNQQQRHQRFLHRLRI